VAPGVVVLVARRRHGNESGLSASLYHTTASPLNASGSVMHSALKLSVILAYACSRVSLSSHRTWKYSLLMA